MQSSPRSPSATRASVQATTAVMPAYARPIGTTPSWQRSGESSGSQRQSVQAMVTSVRQ